MTKLYVIPDLIRDPAPGLTVTMDSGSVAGMTPLLVSLFDSATSPELDAARVTDNQGAHSNGEW